MSGVWESITSTVGEVGAYMITFMFLLFLVVVGILIISAVRSDREKQGSSVVIVNGQPQQRQYRHANHPNHPVEGCETCVEDTK